MLQSAFAIVTSTLTAVVGIVLLIFTVAVLTSYWTQKKTKTTSDTSYLQNLFRHVFENPKVRSISNNLDPNSQLRQYVARLHTAFRLVFMDDPVKIYEALNLEIPSVAPAAGTEPHDEPLTPLQPSVLSFAYTDSEGHPEWNVVRHRALSEGWGNSKQLERCKAITRKEMGAWADRQALFESFDIFSECTRVSTRILLIYLFGNIVSTDVELDHAATIVSDFFRSGAHWSTLLFPWLPFGPPRKRLESKNKLYSFILDCLMQAEHKLGDGQSEDALSDSQEPQPYALVALKYLRQAQHLSQQRRTMRPDILVVAGHFVQILHWSHVNMAMTMAWTFCHLAWDRQLLLEVQENNEKKRAFERKQKESPRCISAFESQQRLKSASFEGNGLVNVETGGPDDAHLECLINEVVAHHSVLPFKARKANSDIHRNSLHIAKGSVVIFPCDSNLRESFDPSFWKGLNSLAKESRAKDGTAHRNTLLFGASEPCCGHLWVKTCLKTMFSGTLTQDHDIHLLSDVFPRADKTLHTSMAYGARAVSARIVRKNHYKSDV